MKYSELIKHINKEFSLIKNQEAPNIDIKAVQIISSSKQISIPGSICIILKYDRDIQLNPLCHYLIPSDYLSYNFRNNVTLYKADDFLKLTLFLQDLLTDKEQYFEKTSQFSKFISNKPSIEELIEYISNLFSMPAVFVDKFFSTISTYPKVKTGIDPFDIYIDSNYINIDTSEPQTNVSELIYPDILRSIISAFKPYEVPCASCPVFNGGEYIGGFAMFDKDNILTQTDLKIIDYIMLMIGNTSAFSHLSDSISYQSLYQHLINNNLTEDLMNKARERLDLDLSAKYYTILIKWPSDINTIDNDIIKIKKALNTELCGIYDFNLCFTFPKESYDPKTINHIIEKAKDKNAGVCVFDLPFDLNKTHIAYKICQKYIDNSPITFCSEQYYEIVFNNQEYFTNDNRNNLLYYSELMSLKEEERITIKEYVYSLLNSNYTASKLCIHRNTLSYRLDKIARVLNIDYDNTQQILNLLLSIKLHNSDKTLL